MTRAQAGKVTTDSPMNSGAMVRAWLCSICVFVYFCACPVDGRRLLSVPRLTWRMMTVWGPCDPTGCVLGQASDRRFCYAAPSSGGGIPRLFGALRTARPTGLPLLWYGPSGTRRYCSSNQLTSLCDLLICWRVGRFHASVLEGQRAAAERFLQAAARLFPTSAVLHAFLCQPDERDLLSAYTL